MRNRQPWKMHVPPGCSAQSPQARKSTENIQQAAAEAKQVKD